MDLIKIDCWIVIEGCNEVNVFPVEYPRVSRECFNTVLARLSEAFQDVIYCSGATTSKVRNLSYGEIVIVLPVYDALTKLLLEVRDIR